jgi:hypothetical protein
MKGGVEIDLPPVSLDEEEPESWIIPSSVVDKYGGIRMTELPSRRKPKIRNVRIRKNEDSALRGTHDRPITFDDDDNESIDLDLGTTSSATRRTRPPCALESDSDSDSDIKNTPPAKRMKLDTTKHAQTKSTSTSVSMGSDVDDSPEAGFVVRDRNVPNQCSFTTRTPHPISTLPLPVAEVISLGSSQSNGSKTGLSLDAANLQNITSTQPTSAPLPSNNAVGHNLPPRFEFSSQPPREIQIPARNDASPNLSSDRGTNGTGPRPTKTDVITKTSQPPSTTPAQSTAVPPISVGPKKTETTSMAHTKPPVLTEKQKGKLPQREGDLSKPTSDVDSVPAETISRAAIESSQLDKDDMTGIPVGDSSIANSLEAVRMYTLGVTEIPSSPVIDSQVVTASEPLPQQAPLPVTTIASTKLSAEQIALTNVVRHVYPLGSGYLPSGRAVVNSKCVDGTPFTRTVCIRSRVQCCSLMSLLHPLLATLTSTLLHRPVDGNHHLVACNALSLSDLCSWAVCLSGPQLETSCPK